MSDFQGLALQGAAQSFLSPEKVPEAIYMRPIFNSSPVVGNSLIYLGMSIPSEVTSRQLPSTLFMSHIPSYVGNRDLLRHTYQLLGSCPLDSKVCFSVKARVLQKNFLPSF